MTRFSALLLVALAVTAASQDSSPDETVLLQQTEKPNVLPKVQAQVLAGNRATHARAQVRTASGSGGAASREAMTGTAGLAKHMRQERVDSYMAGAKKVYNEQKEAAMESVERVEAGAKAAAKVAKVVGRFAGKNGKRVFKAVKKAASPMQAIGQQLDTPPYEQVQGEGWCVDKRGDSVINQVLSNKGASWCREACSTDSSCPGYAVQRRGSTCVLYTDKEVSFQGAPAVSFAISGAWHAGSEEDGWKGGVCYRKRGSKAWKYHRWGIY